MLKTFIRPFNPKAWTSTRAFATSIPLRRPLEMEKVHTSDRLAHLRQLMKSHKVDIYSKTCPTPPNMMAD